MSEASRTLYKESLLRRSPRAFLSDPVDMDTIKDCILTAGTAPSGANLQPWHFVAVTDPEMKRQIRDEAEEVERNFYKSKISDQWRSDLQHLELDISKPFLTQAPCLIVIFRENYRISETGEKLSNYYVPESCGIATGLLINALRNAGYSTLTYTPAPMSFLRTLLHRGNNENPEMILCVGKPDSEYVYPELTRKTLQEILTVI